MCLNKIDKITKEAKYGYKIFSKNGDILRSEIKTNLREIPIGKWIKEEDYRENIRTSKISIGLSKVSYSTGFHCFTRIKDARIWKLNILIFRIYKVQCRKIVVSGTQGDIISKNMRTVVAKEIKVLEEVE